MKLKTLLSEIYFQPQRYFGNIIDLPSIILIYHRVSELNHDPQMLAVTPENFYNQIVYLKKNYNILSVEEFDFLINGKKKLPKKSILITFDDGYADNEYNALSILESLNTQALFFITTSCINTDEEMWWDQLDNVFFSDNDLPKELTISVNKTEFNFFTSSLKDKSNTYRTLHSLIKFNRKETRDYILQNLFNWANIPIRSRKEYRMMNNAELLKMDNSPAAKIGAHTVSHTPLSILNYNEQYEEIKISKEFLESFLNHSVKYFSYPFGNRKDYNRDSVEICKKLNFNFVCANFHSQVHRWTNKFELPRLLVRNWDTGVFKRKMNQFFRY